MYIAIVARQLEHSSNEKPEVQRSAFTAYRKRDAIRAAIMARAEWHERGNGPYRIFVGKLVEEVVTPVKYELVPLKGE